MRYNIRRCLQTCGMEKRKKGVSACVSTGQHKDVHIHCSHGHNLVLRIYIKYADADNRTDDKPTRPHLVKDNAEDRSIDQEASLLFPYIDNKRTAPYALQPRAARGTLNSVLYEEDRMLVQDPSTQNGSDPACNTNALNFEHKTLALSPPPPPKKNMHRAKSVDAYQLCIREIRSL